MNKHYGRLEPMPVSQGQPPSLLRWHDQVYFCSEEESGVGWSTNMDNYFAVALQCADFLLPINPAC